MEPQTKRIIAYLLIPLFVITILVYASYFEIKPDERMWVHFYDVGQGDATFIRTYSGNQILVDGGPGSEVLAQLGKDMPFFDRTLEMIILTHPHADHVNGLVDVIRRYKVRKILMPQVEFDSEPYEIFLNEIKKEGAEIIYAKEGMRVWLDAATALDVYYPNSGALKADNDAKGMGEIRNPNDTSVVAKLTFGKTKFLLTGDAGFDIENYLLPRYNLDTDVLKVGHHGSRFSTSANFINEVTPIYSVVSSGKNNYGHPNPEVINLLHQKNSKVLRTDELGSVRFKSDGNQIYLIE